MIDWWLLRWDRIVMALQREDETCTALDFRWEDEQVAATTSVTRQVEYECVRRFSHTSQRHVWRTHG